MDHVVDDKPKNETLADTMLVVGEYRDPVARDEYLAWKEAIRQEVGFELDAIKAEIRRRLGLPSAA